MELDKIYIQDLSVAPIVGVNPSERKQKQNIIVNIILGVDVRQCAEFDDIKLTSDYGKLSDRISQYIENESEFFTLEALCTAVARICCLEFNAEEVVVKIDKPVALKRARASAVEIKRSKNFFFGREGSKDIKQRK